MDKLYILKLENDKWFIGKSANVEKRYEQHLNGEGDTFTQLHKPVSLELSRDLISDTDQDETVREYMRKYGIENVRGGIYSKTEFNSYDISKIRDDISYEDAVKNRRVFEAKVQNEFTNPDSDLRSGRWLKRFLGINY
jgi:predicted GIY-YIG superfamily endonuclease